MNSEKMTSPSWLDQTIGGISLDTSTKGLWTRTTEISHLLPFSSENNSSRYRSQSRIHAQGATKSEKITADSAYKKQKKQCSETRHKRFRVQSKKRESHQNNNVSCSQIKELASSLCLPSQKVMSANKTGACRLIHLLEVAKEAESW